MKTKTKTKSKTTQSKKSTTKKPVRKVSNKDMDRKSVIRKCDTFTKRLATGTKLITEHENQLQRFILMILFWDCLYTTHSNLFFEKHERENGLDDQLLHYQLFPMVKGRLQGAMRDLVDNGGVAKFQRVLDDINKSINEEKY
tara:strand:- start:92 stop:517 length:426 start_codon:yes stop_codon:yes gene_type:complete